MILGKDQYIQAIDISCMVHVRLNIVIKVKRIGCGIKCISILLHVKDLGVEMVSQ